MANLLFKLFPILWPFVLELFFGAKDHPHDFRREENKPSMVVPILTVAITIMGVILSNVVAENEKLQLELKVALTPSNKLQETSVSLYVCNRALVDHEKRITALLDERVLVDKDYAAKLLAYAASCKAQTGIAPPTPPIATESLSEKAQRRIEALKNKEHLK